MNKNESIMYSEVYSILNMLGKKYINAIPKKLYMFIEKNRDDSYNPTYYDNVLLSKQKISNDTAAFICMLHYNYWCETDNEKRKINKILNYNEQKIREESFKDEEKLYKKDLINNDATNEKNQKIEEPHEEVNNKEKMLVSKKEIKWYKKIVLFFVKIFKNHE